ncbi:MAG: glycosyltransferase family 2 protein [Bacteroidota bacterium]
MPTTLVHTKIAVIIPAYNEEASIGNVVRDIPTDWVEEVVVVNNASTDNTEKNAQEAGATVLQEEERGYGSACLKGISYLAAKENPPNLIVFLDGDYSDYPEELTEVVKPILEGEADMVIGSRVLGKREKGSLTPQQVFGNWLATTLIRWLYGVAFTDLGPFRAIKFDRLIALDMEDKTYGWTVEMQVKAAKNHFHSVEVPVNYRKRIGVSKVSGTIKGSILAGYKILWTIFKLL